METRVNYVTCISPFVHDSLTNFFPSTFPFTCVSFMTSRQRVRATDRQPRPRTRDGAHAEGDLGVGTSGAVRRVGRLGEGHDRVSAEDGDAPRAGGGQEDRGEAAERPRAPADRGALQAGNQG